MNSHLPIFLGMLCNNDCGFLFHFKMIVLLFTQREKGVIIKSKLTKKMSHREAPNASVEGWANPAKVDEKRLTK